MCHGRFVDLGKGPSLDRAMAASFFPIAVRLHPFES
jgi:hypothetical protein